MDFESNYQVSSLSNQIHTYKFFTTLIVNGGSHKNNTSLAHTQKINPWFFTGFTEGNFSISVIKNNKSAIGFKVALFFSIGIHVKDKSLLQKIKNLLSVGTIYKLGEQYIQLKVFSVKDLNIIINHFDKFLLKTKKRSEYELWKQVFNIIKNKEHLTKEGLRKILAIKASMNRGLNPEVKAAYTDIVPVIRPAVRDKKIEDFNGEWIAGFTSDPPTPYYFFNKKIIGVGRVWRLLFNKFKSFAFISNRISSSISFSNYSEGSTPEMKI